MADDFEVQFHALRFKYEALELSYAACTAKCIELAQKVQALEKDSHPAIRNVPDADDVQWHFDRHEERIKALERSVAFCTSKLIREGSTGPGDSND